MTAVVGFSADERGTAALHLGALLARSARCPLVVCTVVPRPWPPNPERIDDEYRALQTQVATEALAHARRRLPGDVEATFLVHDARSASAGLLEVVEQHRATLLVLGSSSAGLFGRVTLGAVTDRLLHSSRVPVAVAPRGFRAPAGERVGRVTVAFGGAASAHDLAVAAGGVAAWVGASLRVASFAVRPVASLARGVEPAAEDLVVEQWAKRTVAVMQEALDSVEGLPEAPRLLGAVIGQGSSWDEALEDVAWRAGDVLVVGSSSSGPVRQVFLGSHTSKILRHSPVPVVVVPRASAAEAAEAMIEG